LPINIFRIFRRLSVRSTVVIFTEISRSVVAADTLAVWDNVLFSNFGFTFGVVSDRPYFFVLRKLYFKSESYLSFLHILYFLEELLWHANLSLTSLQEEQYPRCIVFPLLIHSQFSTLIYSCLQGFLFPYLSYCSRGHVNFGHPLRKRSLTFYT
jgi:hypothetical protein